MAFGIKKAELLSWKKSVKRGEIAFLTHYWQDSRFPNSTTVTKVGCCSISTLIEWGSKYGLREEWIHHHTYPHYDLFGEKQKEVLWNEKLFEHLSRFQL